MKIPVATQVQIVAGLAVAGTVIYLVWKMKNAVNKDPQDWASKIAEYLAKMAVEDAKKALQIAKGGLEGGVFGIGDAIGVPRTSVMLCSQAQAKGDGVAVSKYCSAAEFLKWQWDDLFSSGKVDFIGGGGTFNGNGATGSW